MTLNGVNHRRRFLTEKEAIDYRNSYIKKYVDNV